MYSVVLTEVLQFLVMTVSCIIIGVIAVSSVSPQQLAAVVPEGWSSIGFGWTLELNWSTFPEEINAALNAKVAGDGYYLFSVFMMIVIFRGILVSIAGPLPGYDMQRVLATRNPREAAMMSWFVSAVLFIPRYLLIAGLAIIALVYFRPESLLTQGGLDFEKVLPFALSNFIPAGVLGIILAGLIAAFMSTFAANVNAGPAYIVNDIYKKFINPDASNKVLIRMSYLASVVMVVIGISIGFYVNSINDILQWITAALFGGYAASNMLKWIWWRFNGFGYFWGMMAGLVASLIVPKTFPDMSIIIAFPMIILPLSVVGSFVGCLLTPPDSMKVLAKFYASVRPWGFWQPVIQHIKVEDPAFVENKSFKRDMFNVFVGVFWQMTLILIPVYLVIRDLKSMVIALGVMVVTSIILKYNWFDKLEKD